MSNPLHTIKDRHFIVVPLTFGTIYVSLDSVEDFLYEPEHKLEDGTTTESFKITYGKGKWAATYGAEASLLNRWLLT